MKRWNNAAVKMLLMVMAFGLFGCKPEPAPEEKAYVGEPSQVRPDGAAQGMFSVSPDSKVWFSQGNLQFQASTGTWRFAENQWDVVGFTKMVVNDDQDTLYAVPGTVAEGDNSAVGESSNAWIDLFGWATSGYTHGAVCYQPWSISLLNTDYYAYGDYTRQLDYDKGTADWGFNAISNGGAQEGLWKTLTKEEWNYLLFERDSTRRDSTRFAKAALVLAGNENHRLDSREPDTVKGVILLPDDWKDEYYSLQNVNDTAKEFTGNVISTQEWSDKLEPHGAVFLPAAGYRFTVFTVYIDNPSDDPDDPRDDPDDPGDNPDNPGDDPDDPADEGDSDEPEKTPAQWIEGVLETGRYWTASQYGSGIAYAVSFDSKDLNSKDCQYRCYGQAVRLVRYVKNN